MEKFIKVDDKIYTLETVIEGGKEIFVLGDLLKVGDQVTDNGIELGIK